jgi:hypothetical protein
MQGATNFRYRAEDTVVEMAPSMINDWLAFDAGRNESGIQPICCIDRLNPRVISVTGDA